MKNSENVDLFEYTPDLDSVDVEALYEDPQRQKVPAKEVSLPERTGYINYLKAHGGEDLL